MQYDISVVVVQFNPKLDKLLRTVQSALLQEESNFEIVVADDGSQIDYFNELKLEFEKYNFKNYILHKNKKNQGTVKNILSGLHKCTGKYVRVIAPGDYFYDHFTLKKIVEFMKANNVKEGFGKLAAYCAMEKGIGVYRFEAPKCLDVYLNDSSVKKKIKSILVMDDNISGASYFWEREYYIECLRKIEDRVIYLEDCVNVYTLLEHNKIGFLDEYVAWYEYGVGVTTSNNAEWGRRIKDDWISFLSILKMEFPYNVNIKRALFWRKIEDKKNMFHKIIRLVFFMDRYLYYIKLKKNYGINDQPIMSNLEEFENTSLSK